MNRFEFMRRLEELLSDISPNEKEEALTYYNDYFNDAGEENEQQVIMDLESPEQVAKVVKEGLGFQKQSENIPPQQTPEPAPAAEKKKDSLPAWAIVLIVIGVIFGSPLILSLAAALLGVAVAVIATLLSIVLAFGVTALALFVCGVVFFIVGFIIVPESFWLSIALIGSALLMGAIGILFMILTVLLVGVAIPAMCRGMALLWKKIFHKEKGRS